MATPIIMPKQGQSVETCIISRWFKSTGDKVSVGDLLFSYETDKAAFDLESHVDGTLLEIFYGEGAEVPVLMNVAVIGNPGESVDPYRQGTTIAEKDESSSPVSAINKTVEAAKIATSSDSHLRISPRAKRLAVDKGLNYNNLQGSGPNGRIIMTDIEKALSGGALKEKTVLLSGAEFTEQPLTNVRKIIAGTMYASLQNSAQLTHHMSADVRSILEARRKIKAGIASGTQKQDITLNDMVCFCVIRHLRNFLKQTAILQAIQ